MILLKCPNPECGSHGPFQVSPTPGANGQPPHRVLLCPLCRQVVGVLESDGCDVPADGAGEQTQQAVARLEIAMRNIQSGLTYVRNELATIKARVSRMR